jgi:hypothetical protein
MPRALTVAPVRVTPDNEPAYLAAAGALAAALGRRGQHLWLFRHPTEPGRFLEFREAADAAAHVAVAPTPAESELARSLASLGTYDAGADELWFDVSLPGGAPSGDGSP